MEQWQKFVALGVLVIALGGITIRSLRNVPKKGIIDEFDDVSVPVVNQIAPRTQRVKSTQGKSVPDTSMNFSFTRLDESFTQGSDPSSGVALLVNTSLLSIHDSFNAETLPSRSGLSITEKLVEIEPLYTDWALDADDLTQITEDNKDSLVAAFMAKMPKEGSKDVTNMKISNVPSAGGKVEVVLKCSFQDFNGQTYYRCDDPCSISVDMGLYTINMGGANANWCYVDSILYHRKECPSSDPNFKTRFRGKQMLKLAVGICEHAGYPYQYLVDGAKFPCGRNTGIDISAKVVGLFTSGYTYYMRQGFFPLKQVVREGKETNDVSMLEAQREWCAAKKVAQSTTVGDAAKDNCNEDRLFPGFSEGSGSLVVSEGNRGRRFIESTAKVLGVKEEKVKEMKLGAAYNKLMAKLTDKNETKVCPVMLLAWSLMDNSGGLRHETVLEHFKSLETTCPLRNGVVGIPLNWPQYARFSFGFDKSMGYLMETREKPYQADRLDKMMPGMDYRLFCGISKSEVEEMNLGPGEQCQSVGGITLSKKTANAACKGKMICSSHASIGCCSSKGNPPLEKKKCSSTASDDSDCSCCSKKVNVAGDCA